VSKITYRLRLDDGREYTFPFDVEAAVAAAPAGDPKPPPHWVRLETQQCKPCTLRPDQYPCCPAALAVREVAEHFGNHLSIARVDVWVETPQRTYFKNTDLQSCLRSMFGLAMSLSDCPILSRMRPMAHFHLPFATLEETIFRLVGTYLVKQYLLTRGERGTPDWQLQGMEALYREVETVNIAFLKRVRIASQEDANINAVQAYCSIATLVGMSTNDILEEYAPVLLKGF
jgi:hypothetical protein